MQDHIPYHNVVKRRMRRRNQDTIACCCPQVAVFSKFHGFIISMETVSHCCVRNNLTSRHKSNCRRVLQEGRGAPTPTPPASRSTPKKEIPRERNDDQYDLQGGALQARENCNCSKAQTGTKLHIIPRLRETEFSLHKG